MISAKQPLKVQLLNFMIGSQFYNLPHQNFRSRNFEKLCRISKLHAILNFQNFPPFFFIFLRPNFYGLQQLCAAWQWPCMLSVETSNWFHTPLNNLQPESYSQQAADILRNTGLSCSLMFWTYSKANIYWCLMYFVPVVSCLRSTSYISLKSNHIFKIEHDWKKNTVRS